ncbi:MAG: DAK2 domain-containing protein, partial [Chloroflexota bacterium]
MEGYHTGPTGSSESLPPGSSPSKGHPEQGAVLLEMFRAGEGLIASHLDVINGLNVFPVPDGDTGSNMLATLRQAIETAGEAAARLADGAMLGARGNSGVLLSQLFRGLAEALAGCKSVGGQELATGLRRSSELAYEAVSRPVEGTMLSVLAAAARAAEQAGRQAGEVTFAASRGAEEAVARTTSQLPILQRAQVVDAGGYGLLLILAGCYQALTSRPYPIDQEALAGVERVRRDIASGKHQPPQGAPEHGADQGGFCVTVLARTQADRAALQQDLASMGDSVVVVSTGEQVKLHVHVAEPELVVNYARRLGPILACDISSTDCGAPTESPPLPSGPAVVAIVPGDGLAQVFRGLGASTVVVAWPGSDLSSAEVLKATRQTNARRILLLPTGRDAAIASRQAASLDSRIVLIPSETVPRGVSALLAFDPLASAEANVQRMMAASKEVISAELTAAIRDMCVAGTAVRPGDMLAVLEGELIAAGDQALSVLLDRAS